MFFAGAPPARELASPSKGRTSSRAQALAVRELRPPQAGARTCGPCRSGQRETLCSGEPTKLTAFALLPGLTRLAASASPSQARLSGASPPGTFSVQPGPWLGQHRAALIVRRARACLPSTADGAPPADTSTAGRARLEAPLGPCRCGITMPSQGSPCASATVANLNTPHACPAVGPSHDCGRGLL